MTVNSATIIDPPINVDPAPGERQLGLTMTTALVVGNMIGSGIFLLPALLAPYGANATYGWLVAIAGAMFVAVTFALLSAHIEGGPFVYVEEAFGADVAFIVMWSYLISIWTANAILPIAAVSNLSHIAPVLGHPIVAPASAIVALWIFWGVNTAGARSAGIVQVATTFLKALPLIAILLVAAVYLGRGVPPAPQSAMPVSTGAIAGAAALALFSMLGIESATVSSDKVKNPLRTIPMASVAGSAIAGAIYLGVTWAVLYLLPSNIAAASPSPLADAAQPMVGPFAGSLIALFAGVSALGALNGWILCSGEIPLKLARDGAFPAWFGKTTGRGTPVRAQLVGCLVATLLIVSNYSKSMSSMFEFITLISVVATLVLYVACSGGALTILFRRGLGGPLLAVCALVALAFSLWSFWGAGLQPSLWGLALVATGIPVWFVVRRSRRLSPTPGEAANPAAPRGSSA